MGTRTPAMVIPDTRTRSRLPPSTDSRETPALGNGFHSFGYGFHLSTRAEMVQLRNTIFLKSPLDSVPRLSALRTLTSAQSATSMFSVDPRTPRARLVLATIASSRDSTRHLTTRTFRQQSGVIPSA